MIKVGWAKNPHYGRALKHQVHKQWHGFRYYMDGENTEGWSATMFLAVVTQCLHEHMVPRGASAVFGDRMTCVQCGHNEYL